MAAVKNGRGRPTKEAVRRRELGTTGVRALDKIENALRVARAEVKQIEDAADAEIKRIRSESDALKRAAQTRVKEIESHLTAVGSILNGGGAVLTGLTAEQERALHQRTKRTTKRGKKRTAAQRVGKGNVEAVAAELRRRGRATQAEIARGLGKNAGTVSYAMRALADDPTIRPTGRLVDRSREYEYVPPQPEPTPEPTPPSWLGGLAVPPGE